MASRRQAARLVVPFLAETKFEYDSITRRPGITAKTIPDLRSWKPPFQSVQEE
jgi:hypothetical protein